LIAIIAVAVFLILIGLRVYEDWTFVHHMARAIEKPTGVKRDIEDCQFSLR
jgi:Tfp pilus assembly major pilin PilA